MLSRRKLAMITAELVGTGLLTLVMLAVTKSTIGIPYFVAIAAGLVVAGMTLALGAVSGAHLNPAITLGLWSVRRVKTLPAIVYIAAQMLGAVGAYLLYTYFVDQSWPNNTQFDSRVLVAEAVGAMIFGLGWAAAVYQNMTDGARAAVIGISLMLGIVVAAIAAGGLINPAVALGMRSWVWGSFVLGPILGAIVGFNLYALLFASENSLLNRTAGTAAKPKAAAVEAEIEAIKPKSAKKKK